MPNRFIARMTDIGFPCSRGGPTILAKTYVAAVVPSEIAKADCFCRNFSHLPVGRGSALWGIAAERERASVSVLQLLS
jgi:hypothetical protein